ncbi:MAG: hypothetical protein MJY59_06005 [Bacteroidaceae bacterium]|nr:hypothetical protein [Bacteroidaceae bacterium]
MRKEYVKPSVSDSPLLGEEMATMSFTDTLADPAGEVLANDRDSRTYGEADNASDEAWSGFCTW